MAKGKGRGWSTPPTMFREEVDGAVAVRIRVIAMAMLQEIVLRSPVGNPSLWKVNTEMKSRNVAMADAYDANVDARNATNTGKKQFKKLTQRERKENFFVDAKAAGKGYIGGTFRGSHIVSVGTPDFTVVENVDPSGSETINKGAMMIKA